jgi:hypothetical protein
VHQPARTPSPRRSARCKGASTERPSKSPGSSSVTSTTRPSAQHAGDLVQHRPVAEGIEQVQQVGAADDVDAGVVSGNPPGIAIEQLPSGQRRRAAQHGGRGIQTDRPLRSVDALGQPAQQRPGAVARSSTTSCGVDAIRSTATFRAGRSSASCRS